MLVAAQVYFLGRSVKGHAYRRHTSVDESKQRTIGFTRYRWCSFFFETDTDGVLGHEHRNDEFGDWSDDRCPSFHLVYKLL
jgi:hypothetical protein